jgi:hypothetical protein
MEQSLLIAAVVRFAGLVGAAIPVLLQATVVGPASHESQQKGNGESGARKGGAVA